MLWKESINKCKTKINKEIRAMRKQEEIQVLQSLKGDTYFAQKFGSDIDQMCENIKNDFPIEMGCVFMTETEALKKTLAQTKKKADEELLAFAQEIILNICNYDDKEVYKTVKSYIGIEAVIKYKHSQNIKLNEEEIDYLVGKIK